METKKQGSENMHFFHLMLNKIKKIPLLFFGFLLIFFSNLAFSAYTFTSTGSASGASGCSGNSSGVYTCSSGFDNNGQTTTINNSSGPVTINVNGDMKIRSNVTVTSPTHAVTINVSSKLEIKDNRSVVASDGSTSQTNISFNVGGDTEIETTGTILGTIKATSSGKITLASNPTIYGSLTTSSGLISAYGRIYGSLVSTTGAITKDSGSVSESIITTSGAIKLLNATSVKHITCDCALTVAYAVTVTGNIQVASMSEDPDGSQSTYNGSIYTTTGGVKLKYSSDVAGSITSATTVNLVDQNTVNSCVKSTSSSTITLGWGVNANSVCCGSSCSNSCVSKNASVSMPPACTTEQVVINARGDQFYGTYPIMELWVNGTKLGSVSVTGNNKDYFFNVVLPTTITSLDVVFPNDEANSTGDRNLYLNTVIIRGKTLRPTDSGVVIDWGDSNTYSTFFDGISTVPGQVGVYWESAVRFVPDFSGTLIASYNFDQTSWNGTAGELEDTAGYSGGPFHGKGIGSPISTATNTSPAISGSTGTCGYATFSGSVTGGSAFQISNLPVSTTTGAKTSVSFWMYWDGNTWKMPIGWNKYNLAFGGTYFGFNTSNSDLYGTSSSGLANGWHHVVAVFTNGNVTSNKIYIDGVNKTLSQHLGSPANQHAVVQSTVQVSGWTNPDWETTNYRFTDSRIDELKVYDGEISPIQVANDYAATHSCSSPSPLAYYKFDEASWTGLANEVVDSSGNGYHARVDKTVATDRAVIENSSTNQFKSGSVGTCSYGVMGNYPVLLPSSFPNLTNSMTYTSWVAILSSSATKTIFADDNNNAGGYGLQVLATSSKLRFYKRSAGGVMSYVDSTYSLSTGTKYFVGVSVNQTAQTATIYVFNSSGTLLAETTGAISNFGLSDSGSTTIGNESTTSSEQYGLHGRLDEVRIFNSALSRTQIAAFSTSTHSCVTNTNASSFNCISAQETDVASGRLYTQLAGSSFGIQVIALKSSGTAAETSFSTASSRDVTLKFIDQINSNEITFNDGSDKTAKTLTFPAGDTTGILTVSGLKINNAYKNLKCQVIDSTASLTSSSNDSFSVRPYQLVISSTNATDSSSTSAANTQKIIAGANFNLTATAKNSSGTTLTGYNGTPSVSASSITPHTGAIATGTLGGSFSSAASSGVASANFTYSEVGYFKLNASAVTDTSFVATVDSAASGDCTDDFSVTAVSGKYGCKIQNISESSYFGRFIPERFNVDDASVTSSNACANFTYYGQEGFNTQFILRAQNMSGGRTKNYQGSYAKLDINTWTDDSALTGLKFLATNLPSGVSLLAGSSNPTGSWSQGQATIYATHKLSRPANVVAPVNLILKTNPLDSDGVYVINNTPEAANIPANSLFRYGRLWVPNVYGSELLDLTVPVEAQYWSSNGVYQRNQLDSCSAIAPANFAMANYKGNLAACETVISGGGTMASGKTTMTLSKPGNGNNGSVDLSLNLNSAAGSTCTSSTASSATNANLPQFGTSNPTARETFGLFKSPVIYMRENY